jgi:hypothetical protein
LEKAASCNSLVKNAGEPGENAALVAETDVFVRQSGFKEVLSKVIIDGTPAHAGI